MPRSSSPRGHRRRLRLLGILLRLSLPDHRLSPPSPPPCPSCVRRGLESGTYPVRRTSPGRLLGRAGPDRGIGRASGSARAGGPGRGTSTSTCDRRDARRDRASASASVTFPSETRGGVVWERRGQRCLINSRPRVTAREESIRERRRLLGTRNLAHLGGSVIRTSGARACRSTARIVRTEVFVLARDRIRPVVGASSSERPARRRLGGVARIQGADL